MDQQQQDKKQQQGASRRDFLKTAATATAAVAAAGQLIVPPAVHAAEGDGSGVVKFGLIGCGGRGTGAAGQALRANPNNHLVAMADMFADVMPARAASLKKQHEEQVKVTPESMFAGPDAFKKLIDSDVDVVLLTTPPGFRPIHFKYAVEKGKHVFAEKPVCVDAAGYRSVIQTIAEARKKNLAFVDGFCWRYSIGERQIFPQIHQGAIGDVVSIYSTYNTTGLKMSPRQEGWSDAEWQLRNWLYFTWLSGDHLVEQAVHTVDKVAWAMNDVMPERCWATGGRQSRTAPAYGHIFDHFAVVYEWANGTRAHVYCRQQDGTDTAVSDHMIGTKGTCDITSDFSPKNNSDKYVIRMHGGKGPEIRLKDIPKEFTNAYQVEHDELFASIRAGKPINSGERVPNSAMMSIMGRMAAYTGKIVTWKEAIASKEDLFPKDFDPKGPMETPAVAQPGLTKIG